MSLDLPHLGAAVPAALALVIWRYAHLQAQAGHRSLDTTRLYVHLANGWLADEYDKATASIDADMFVAAAGGIGR